MRMQVLDWTAVPTSLAELATAARAVCLIVHDCWRRPRARPVPTARTGIARPCCRSRTAHRRAPGAGLARFGACSEVTLLCAVHGIRHIPMSRPRAPIVSRPPQPKLALRAIHPNSRLLFQCRHGMSARSRGIACSKALCAGCPRGKLQVGSYAFIRRSRSPSPGSKLLQGGSQARDGHEPQITPGTQPTAVGRFLCITVEITLSS